MIKKIPYREIQLCAEGSNAKKWRRTKPCGLQSYPQCGISAEKQRSCGFLLYKTENERKRTYLRKRKEFDKSVQGCKRAY